MESIDNIETQRLLAFHPQNGMSNLFYYNLKDLPVKYPFNVIHSLDFKEDGLGICLKVESQNVGGQ